MGLNEAIVAQGMATRHRRSVPTLVKGFSGVNGLLNKMLKGNKIKWGGYGINFDWYAGKLNDTATWTSGQLGTRTFEEKDPAEQATLPYCLIDSTYGVSEKSIKSNRAAGENKIYDIQAENAANAQHAIYNAFATAMYYGGTDTKVPVGLYGILGGSKGPYFSSADATTVAAASYAGIAMVGGSNITAWAANKASYARTYWAPEVTSTETMPTALAKGSSYYYWKTGAPWHLFDMENMMAISADQTGTGQAIKPDMAFMRLAQYQALLGLLFDKGLVNIELADKDLLSVGIKNVQVNGITAVYDTNVPLDNTYQSSGTGYPMVLVVDSSKFSIETYNTKSEGLVEAEWKQDDPTIIGGVGVYKSSFAIRCETPNAVGCILVGDQA